MVEISRSEFEDAFQYICDDIRRATFIAVDTEFTGLTLNAKTKPSLFDNGEARYQKLRQCVKGFIPSQIGVAAYMKNGDSNTYEARCYNFYLFPQSFGPRNLRFQCEAASLEFLTCHKFDFNKFVYDGVSFMNNEQEKLLRRHLVDNNVGLDLENEDRQGLQGCCSEVAEWLVAAQEGDQLTVTCTTGVSDFVVLTELRLRFPTTWTRINPDGHMVVERVSEEARQKVAAEAKNDGVDRMVNQMLGFTRVFRKIVELKKPVVAHNCLLDFIMMYEHFYDSLPNTFSKFKEKITALFPCIYDTKHLSNECRMLMPDTVVFQQTALMSLRNALYSDKAQFYALYAPRITCGQGFDRYTDQDCPHEAGFDAYMCGQVFLRMVHIMTLYNKKSHVSRSHESHIHRPHEWYEYGFTLKHYKHNINLIRGSVDYVSLHGADPPSRRPQYLHVQPRQSGSPFNAAMVAQLFSGHGCVDVQMSGTRAALVAVSNHRAAKEIFRNFRKHKTMIVSKYSYLKHSPVARRVMWSGVVISGSVCAIIVFGILKSKTT